MRAIISKIYLRKLNSYLLINNPTVWATKLHYLIFYALIFLAVGIYGAYKLPITYTRATSPTIAMICLSVAIVMFYMTWLVEENLLWYQKIHGVTGYFFHLKILITVYIALTISAVVFYCPFLIYLNRLEGQFIDKELPTLNLNRFQTSVRSSMFYFDHPIYDIREQRNKPIDELIDFNSSDLDSVHSFRSSFYKPLTNTEMINHYLLSSGIGIDSIRSNSSIHIIHPYYAKRASPTFSKVIQEIRSDQFHDDTIKTKLYDKRIIVRTFYASSEDHKNGIPIKIYFYKSRNGTYYRYCDENSIHGSLLVDSMISLVGKEPTEAKLKKLSSIVESLEPLQKLSYVPFILALGMCIVLTIQAYIASLFGKYYSTASISLCLLATMSTLLFFPSTGNLLRNHLWIPIIIVAIACLLIWKLSNQKSKSDLTVMLALIAMMSPLYFIIVLTVAPSGTFIDARFSFNKHFLEILCSDFRLTFLAALIFFTLIPWFFANKMHRLSILPYK